MSEKRPYPDNPRYLASVDGSVWGPSGKKLSASKRCRLKPYLAITLMPERKTENVHRIVAAAFLGQCPEGMSVAHKNGNPTDNRPENLCYATMAENISHKHDHGTMPVGESHHQSKLREREVLQIMSSPQTAASLASQYGVGETTIRHIKNGETWRHLSELRAAQ